MIVSIGSSTSPTTFYKYSQNITNIQKGDEQLQEFTLCPLLRELFSTTGKFDLIKVGIVGNHGNPRFNTFSEFQLL